MWKVGVALTALSLVVTIPTILALFEATSSPLVAGLNLDWLSGASMVCLFVDTAQLLLRSLFAYYLYKRKLPAGFTPSVSSCRRGRSAQTRWSCAEAPVRWQWCCTCW